MAPKLTPAPMAQCHKVVVAQLGRSSQRTCGAYDWSKVCHAATKTKMSQRLVDT